MNKPPIKLDIWLNKQQIAEALVEYALKKVDLGVPYGPGDALLFSASIEEAHIELIPDRINKA